MALINAPVVATARPATPFFTADSGSKVTAAAPTATAALQPLLRNEIVALALLLSHCNSRRLESE